MTQAKLEDSEVVLKDSMGSDIDVCDAARVSFHKETIPEPDGSVSAKDVKLIKYLADHDHWSPLAHVFLKFRVKAPIFVARQLVKHQVGLVWNEVSRRYVDDEPTFYLPETWRVRPDKMKQGSSETETVTKMKRRYVPVVGSGVCGSGLQTNEEVEYEVDISNTVKGFYSTSLSLYNDMLEAGVAPEQARMVLPQAMHTEWIWSGSLAAFARICKLRLDPHAQKECRDVAKWFDKLIPQKLINSWNALMGRG